MRKSVVSFIAFATLSACSWAQSLSNFSLSSLSVAGSVGVYFPTSSDIRHLFKSELLSFGVGPWMGNRVKGGFSPEIGIISGNDNGNKFIAVPIALAYEQNFFIDDTKRYVPYVRVSGGVAYFDYSITDDAGDHFGLKRLGSTAGLEAGLKFSKFAKFFVKYDLFSTEQHFNFSGLQVGIVAKLFKL